MGGPNPNELYAKFLFQHNGANIYEVEDTSYLFMVRKIYYWKFESDLTPHGPFYSVQGTLNDYSDFVLHETLKDESVKNVIKVDFRFKRRVG